MIALLTVVFWLTIAGANVPSAVRTERASGVPLDRGILSASIDFIFLTGVVVASLFGAGIARLGRFRGDVFVAGAVVFCSALLLLFVAVLVAFDGTVAVTVLLGLALTALLASLDPSVTVSLVAPVADWETKRRWVDYAFKELEKVGYTFFKATPGCSTLTASCW